MAKCILFLHCLTPRSPGVATLQRGWRPPPATGRWWWRSWTLNWRELAKFRATRASIIFLSINGENLHTLTAKFTGLLQVLFFSLNSFLNSVDRRFPDFNIYSFLEFHILDINSFNIKFSWMDLIRLGRLACAQRNIEVLYQRKRRYMVCFVQMNYKLCCHWKKERMYLFCTSYKFHCFYLRTNKRSVHSKVLTQTNSTLLKMLNYSWNLNTNLSL